MPFFKFRRGDASSGPPSGFTAQVDSVEVIRKRARHRLIGASVLVLLGVVGFPLLFDTQPRPMPADIPIEIPAKNSVKPLFMPAPAAPPAQKVSVVASLPPKEEGLPPSTPVAPVAPAAPAPPVVKKEAKPEPKREAKAEEKNEARPASKPEPKPAELKPAEAKPAEAKPAEAKPESKPARKLAEAQVAGARSDGAIPALAKPVAAEGKGRSVVQVGAFSDNGKADETRAKLERAGLKTYTQIIDTKEGKRIRVRVGPFATKAEAEKAGSKIRSLDLPVAILTF